MFWDCRHDSMTKRIHFKWNIDKSAESKEKPVNPQLQLNIFPCEIFFLADLNNTWHMT